MTTAPSCQLSPCMKNSSAAKNAPAQAKPAMCHFLRLRPVHDRADDRQDEGAEDRGEAGQVERQRAGREVQAEHVDGLGRRCRPVVAAAGGLAGDGDHVRREEHREHGRVEGRVGPVVPVPGLLLLRARSAGRGRRTPWSTSVIGSSLHRPRSMSTSLSRSVRSVNRPSTPRSSSVLISSGSSMVQTCTCLPARVRPAYEPGVAIVSRPRRCGIWRAADPAAGEPVRRAGRWARSRKIATSTGRRRGGDPAAR